MKTYKNGYRWKDVCEWETLRHMPYDYERNGLMDKLLSGVIIRSRNPILKVIIYFIEQVMILMMKYTDVLKNFKNPNWKNR